MSRVSSEVNKMKSYAEDIFEETIVEKVLMGLTLKFECIVTAIEESLNLFDYYFDE